MPEEERPIYELLEQTFSDEKDLDNAVEKLSGALLVNANLYMEIGLQSEAAALAIVFLKRMFLQLCFYSFASRG